MSHLVDPDQNAHFSRLRDSYRAVGDRTWSDQDFQKQNMDISRGLFVPESLHSHSCKPRPKALEVYALLSGLPFSKNFTDKLVSVQMQISKTLANSLHYWVKPQNLGVEYCVFKWPMDSWNDEQRDVINDVLGGLSLSAFKLHINGVQINPDGCVVARGYDEGAQIFRLRELLKARILFLPERQSGWAHVPLGRILEPLGSERFDQLRRLMNEMSDLPLATTEIDRMEFIHETRWYMEERESLAVYPLVNAND